MLRVLKDLKAFRQACEVAESTDTGEAWDLLERMEEALQGAFEVAATGYSLPPKPANTRMTSYPIWLIIDPERGDTHQAVIGICFDGVEANSVLDKLNLGFDVSEAAYIYVMSGHRSPRWIELYDARPEAW